MHYKNSQYIIYTRYLDRDGTLSCYMEIILGPLWCSDAALPPFQMSLAQSSVSLNRTYSYRTRHHEAWSIWVNGGHGVMFYFSPCAVVPLSVPEIAMLAFGLRKHGELQNVTF